MPQKKLTGAEIRDTDFFVEHKHTLCRLILQNQKVPDFSGTLLTMPSQLQRRLSITHIRLNLPCHSMRCHIHPRQL